MMGLHITTPFQTLTETGFPQDLIKALEERCGHKVIGNKAASGTEILDELAEEEIATGNMIVYTSADSVLQICGNEETFGLEELYRCCEIARVMNGRWAESSPVLISVRKKVNLSVLPTVMTMR